MTTAPWLRFPRKTCIILLALVAALLSATTGTKAQQPLFPVTSFYNPPSPASTFATGDFNGDGQPDIAFASPPVSAGQFATLTVLLNNGASSPTPVVTNSLSCITVSQIVAADINNDKKLDLVISCVEGEVVVLLGNGDGTFQKPASYATTGTPVLAQPVDLNGDGYPDIAASTPAAVLVMLNQGSGAPGTLLPAKTYPVPTGLNITLAGVQGGDFNGDGKQDLIAVNTDPTQSIPFVLFYGNGDGTLQTPQIPYEDEIAASGPFITADFNHDGITDIAYLGAGSGNIYSIPGSTLQSVTVLLNSSSGKFTVSGGITFRSLTGYTNLVYAGSTKNGISLALTGNNTVILNADINGVLSVGPSYNMGGTPQPQNAGDANTNLLFSTPGGFSLLTNNGDGTFQGIPTLPVGTNGFVAADFNGDGITDILTINFPFSVAAPNLVTAIGRGNGTFLPITETPIGVSNGFLLAGDFNGDGKIDAALIQPNPIITSYRLPAALLIYAGNGDGSFQSTPTTTNLSVVGPSQAVAGDFDGDGNLDVVLSYSQTSPNPTISGLVFLPGKGNGTFGTPVTFAPSTSSPSGPLLSADLNNDKLPDLIWNGAAYLSNGDGTFRQVSLGFTGTPLAIGDLNGDGIPDIVIQPPSVAGIAPPAAIYAGNGDGTFHSAALYTTTALPASTTVTSVVIGDVNADGHPDLILQYQSPNLTAGISVYFGDGKGNFTPDSNTYFAGGSIQGTQAIAQPVAVLTRLNNQALSLPSDGALDYLTFTSGGATTLLNQSNPAPAPPPLFSTTTTLSAFSLVAAPTEPIEFTAAVTGVSPTGTVNLTSGGTTLGTGSVAVLASYNYATINASFPKEGTYTVSSAYSGNSSNQPSSSNTLTVTIARVPSTPSITTDAVALGANQVFHFIINVSGYAPTGTVTVSLADGTNIGTAQATNGQASFAYVFPVAGTYTVYANYAGDVANLPSTSSPFILTVMPQDFNFTAFGNEATIPDGQSATTTLTIAPTFGYSGTVKFSCGQLLSGEACTFTPPTVRSLNGFSQVTSVFVISTTAPELARLRRPFDPLQGITWATLLGLALFRKRIHRGHKYLAQNSLLALLLAFSLLQLSACSSSSPSSTQTTTPPPTSGTPKGTQTLVITAADTTGSPSHTLTVQLTIE